MRACVRVCVSLPPSIDDIHLVPQCSLPGCSRPRFIQNGEMFDCCSRRHGKQYLQLQLQQQQPPPPGRPGTLHLLPLATYCHIMEQIDFSVSVAMPLELKCKNPNCYRQRYPVGNGTYYDYCGITCRDSLQLQGPGVCTCVCACM